MKKEELTRQEAQTSATMLKKLRGKEWTLPQFLTECGYWALIIMDSMEPNRISYEWLLEVKGYIPSEDKPSHSRLDNRIREMESVLED